MNYRAELVVVIGDRAHHAEVIGEMTTTFTAA